MKSTAPRFLPTSTDPGKRSARPSPATRPARVLLLERQPALRHALRDLLRNQGMEVTAAAPEAVKLGANDWAWDAVVFTPEQRPLKRQRWLFGHRPPLGRTRLVALHDQDRSPAYDAHEVDASLPYPLSVSTLVQAILGRG